jgi:proline iminopeptidase
MDRSNFVAALAVATVACGGPPLEIPSSEALMSINGTELFVKRMGAGEPIIVVHGGPVLEHGYLLPHLAPLAESYELIFYDQRLSGRSARSVDSSSVRLATFVDDIEALRRALGLDRFHLMAHSWGGLLAMHYAVRYGDNLQSLVLLNSMSASSALWREEEAAMAQRMTEEDNAERAAIRETEAFANQDPEAIAQLLQISFKPQFHDRALASELVLYVPDDYPNRSRQFGHMMVDLLSFDIHDGLAGVTVPTLILYGSDEVGAKLGGTALHRELQRSTFVVIGDAGHFPFIEQPGEFVREVTSFLEEQ